MNGKVIYITSYFPFGHHEIWTSKELSSLTNVGVEILVIPRMGTGSVFHASSRKFLPYTLAVPFLNRQILVIAIATSLRYPLLLVKITLWIFQQSNTWVDFVKGLVVLLKSIYLATLLKDEEIAHIHAYATSTVAVTAFILSRLLQKPWSFTLHTSSIIREDYRRSFRAQMEAAQFARTMSEEATRKLLEFMGSGYADKVKMVYAGENCEGELPAPFARKGYFVIATPAALLPHKAHQIALKASRLLLDRKVSNFKWYFYGEGPLRSVLENQIKEMGLDGIVELVGKIDHEELLDKYRAGQIDIVVMTSMRVNGTNEGIPAALREAMIFGIPVISTNSGATVELIGDEAGMQVEQGNAVATADAIQKLLEDNEFRNIQGQRGRDRIFTKFNATLIAQRLRTLFLGEADCGI